MANDKCRVGLKGCCPEILTPSDTKEDVASEHKIECWPGDLAQAAEFLASRYFAKKNLKSSSKVDHI